MIKKGQLPRKKELAIKALLVNDTQEEAAQAIGLTPKTLRVWQRQPEFAQAYKEARQEVLTASIKKLQSITGQAVETLHDCLINAKSDASRIQAAKTILEYSLRGFILENVLTDIEEIKSNLEGRYYDGV